MSTQQATRTQLLSLLEAVENGRLGPAAALEQLASLPFRELGFAKVDTHRDLRQHAPEAVLAEGKAPEEIELIVKAMLESSVSTILVTRADEDARAAVLRAAPGADVDERARLAWVAREVPPTCGRVAIVSAGTSDYPVVREAQVRAELLGASVTVEQDIGVAGLHRIASALPELERADCVVVVAGQDAALASVVGGLVSAPVIAVPTSRGYGASFGGLSALLAMLTSCAAGVAVVNIDDGLGAGTIAARIARAAAGAT
jgi:NCAIR mutase (PurE)-related protein